MGWSDCIPSALPSSSALFSFPPAVPSSMLISHCSCFLSISCQVAGTHLATLLLATKPSDPAARWYRGAAQRQEKRKTRTSKFHLHCLDPSLNLMLCPTGPRNRLHLVDSIPSLHLTQVGLAPLYRIQVQTGPHPPLLPTVSSPSCNHSEQQSSQNKGSKASVSGPSGSRGSNQCTL